MRIKVLLIAAIGIIVILGFFGISTVLYPPQGTLIKYLEAINTGDISTVNALASQEAKNPRSGGLFSGVTWAPCPKPRIINVKETWSTARVDLTCQNRMYPVEYILIREYGRWKVHSFGW